MTLTGQSGTVPSIGLNDENTMPALGLGVGELGDAETEHAVSTALELGYRLIDTAAVYGNEAAVGRAIAASGIPRAEVFVTTKLAVADQGFQSSQDAIKASLERLGMEYVDLYLIHWPYAEGGKYIDSFGGMMRSQADGLAKSIGVCNFTAEHLSDIIDLTFFTPAVNQIELHPLLNQSALRAVNADHGIVTEAYSPLGIGKVLQNPAVTTIAASYGKSPAQVLIRWNLQLGNVVIPRSSSAERISENLDVFGFELSAADMETLNGLDEGTRFRPDPMTYTGP
ncbi:2,5-didehydrogluconate reductase A [Mycobacterium sp. MS1601]|uniref:aldo/keto reductase n=1 Tax=Mycobacterium sp. MS1601 TaxID=1936029 RepID=UPI000979707C|nr:aldo/keto reductase [Mycobacterium sp. MS1601]AQA05998.1 2,5-didehydrogluconate reductase A [Mycobacterium sp. MS1601]